MARMTAMLKDLEQEVRLLKEGRTQEIRDTLLVTRMGRSQKKGQQWKEEPILST